MSVQLLDKTRKINQLLQNSNGSKVIFSDICEILSGIIDGNALVISKKGKILGEGLKEHASDLGALVPEGVGNFVDPLFDERVLSILSTKENVNLETLGFDKDAVSSYQAIVSPVFIAGERLGTLMAYRTGGGFDIDDIIISEYAATVIGMAMRQSVNEEYAEETRKLQIVRGAIATLSFSEMEAVTHIFHELKGSEGILVASKIADRVGITRSVIVNALRKFESAGVIESRSSGMRGTYIKVLNDAVFEEIERVGAVDRSTSEAK
ncbi:MAG: GTP-sensing pleiotropic transcriptional regulator CodY [Stomatobaculum sp.]